jgi:hypothetical protein
MIQAAAAIGCLHTKITILTDKSVHPNLCTNSNEDKRTGTGTGTGAHMTHECNEDSMPSSTSQEAYLAKSGLTSLLSMALLRAAWGVGAASHGDARGDVPDGGDYHMDIRRYQLCGLAAGAAGLLYLTCSHGARRTHAGGRENGGDGGAVAAATGSGMSALNAALRVCHLSVGVAAVLTTLHFVINDDDHGGAYEYLRTHVNAHMVDQGRVAIPRCAFILWIVNMCMLTAIRLVMPVNGGYEFLQIVLMHTSQCIGLILGCGRSVMVMVMVACGLAAESAVADYIAGTLGTLSDDGCDESDESDGSGGGRGSDGGSGGDPTIPGSDIPPDASGRNAHKRRHRAALCYDRPPVGVWVGLLGHVAAGMSTTARSLRVSGAGLGLEGSDRGSSGAGLGLEGSDRGSSEPDTHAHRHVREHVHVRGRRSAYTHVCAAVFGVSVHVLALGRLTYHLTGHQYVFSSLNVSAQ